LFKKYYENNNKSKVPEERHIKNVVPCTSVPWWQREMPQSKQVTNFHKEVLNLYYKRFFCFILVSAHPRNSP